MTTPREEHFCKYISPLLDLIKRLPKTDRLSLFNALSLSNRAPYVEVETGMLEDVCGGKITLGTKNNPIYFSFTIDSVQQLVRCSKNDPDFYMTRFTERGTQVCYKTVDLPVFGIWGLSEDFIERHTWYDFPLFLNRFLESYNRHLAHYSDEIRVQAQQDMRETVADLGVQIDESFTKVSVITTNQKPTANKVVNIPA